MAVPPPSPIHFNNPGDVTVENIFFPDNAKLPMGSQCLVQETAKGVSDAGKPNPVSPSLSVSCLFAARRTMDFPVPPPPRHSHTILHT